MSYLSQFMSLGIISRALINLAACIFAAILASFAVPTKLSPPFTQFITILRNSVGFGLGVACTYFVLFILSIFPLVYNSYFVAVSRFLLVGNLFLEGIFAPDRIDASHIVGLAGYLAIVALITFRVAAQVPVDQTEESTTIERLWILLTFAMQTVTAFTLVAFTDTLTADGWIGHFENLFILLLFAALISTLVARIDTTTLNEQENNENEEENCGLDHMPCILRLLVFVPCVWICCPWAPLVFLLSGVNDVGIKEKWFQVSNMIGGLAASIEASGMLTRLTNEISSGLGVCGEKQCNYPWIFVLLQAGIALIATIVLLPILTYVVPDFLVPSPEESEIVTNEVPKHKLPIKFITATQSDTVSLLSGPTSKYNIV